MFRVGILRARRILSGGLLVAGTLAAQGFQTGPLLHQRPSVAVAHEPLTLEIILDLDDANVQLADIYFRLAGQTAFAVSPMSTTDGALYFGTIPAGDIIAGELEYYFALTLDDGTLLAFPEVEPTLNPVIVPIIPGQDFQPDAVGELAAADVQQVNADILILAPEPDNTFLPENVVIAVSLFNVANVDVATIQLIVDGRDVTNLAEISADIVAYTPAGLSNGAHRVEVRLSDLSGAMIRPVSWSFNVTRKVTASTEFAFKQSGRATLGSRTDEIEGANLSVQVARISYRAGWNWLKFRSNIKLSTNEDAFKPARNRYKAEIELPLLKIGVGDVTPRTNRFALDGKRVRGYLVDIDLKYLKLQVAQGQLDRTNQGRDNEAYAVTNYLQTGFGDTANYTINISRDNYGFRRDVTAVRAGLGSGRVFEWSFSYLKAKDNVTSVDSVLDDGKILITDSTFVARFFDDFLVEDTVNLALVTFEQLRTKALQNSSLNYVLPSKDWEDARPKDNIVIGSDISLALNQRRIVLQSGFAFSMLNTNIWDPVLTKDDLDTFAPGDTTENDSILDFIAIDDIPFDPADYEDIFHMNLNMLPLVPIDPTLALDDPLQAILKMPSMAYHASAKFNYLRNFITLDYQQVGPEFNSLGNPNLQKNVRIRTISDRIRMFKNKLFITASFRTTDDDIVKLEGDPITSTETLMFSAALNLGVGLPGINVSTRSLVRKNGVTALDTLISVDSLGASVISGFRDTRENTVTNSLNLGVNYRLALLTTTHDLSVTISNTLITDELAGDRDFDPAYRSPSASSNVTAISVQSTLSPRLRTSLTFSTNQSEFGAGDDLFVVSEAGDTTITGPGLIAQDLLSIGLSGTLRLMNRRLTLRAGVNLINGNTDRSISALAPPNFSRTGIKTGIEYTIIENLRLVASYEARSRSLEKSARAKASTALSSVLALNLNYVF
ncbi:MAG: hypothetical protein IIA59_07910 [Candidatus Marinimicrobia bacterium]|nr:hypothetical protein [Candidatus Neomarinimicrobiota bacterium]